GHILCALPHFSGGLVVIKNNFFFICGVSRHFLKQLLTDEKKIKVCVFCRIFFIVKIPQCRINFSRMGAKSSLSTATCSLFLTSSPNLEMAYIFIYLFIYLFILH